MTEPKAPTLAEMIPVPPVCPECSHRGHEVIGLVPNAVVTRCLNCSCVSFIRLIQGIRKTKLKKLDKKNLDYLG